MPLNYEKADFKQGEDITVRMDKSDSYRLAYFEIKNRQGELLLDSKGIEQSFVYNDQFLQIIFKLGYTNVYGMGENSHSSFRHEFSYTNWWGVFARDQPPGGKSVNLYGTHPFFMAVNEKTGRAMGVFIQNSNAQEYAFLPPTSVAYRTLGGIFDIYIMEEDTPEKVVQAYTSLIGKPYMPPLVI